MNVTWLSPRQATNMISHRLDVSVDQAIAAFCRRSSYLHPQLIVSMADRIIGLVPVDIPPPLRGTQTPIWPFFWQTDFARDPRNSLWSTGDTEFAWGSTGERCAILGVTFSAEGVEAFLSLPSANANDNEHGLRSAPVVHVVACEAMPALTDQTGGAGRPSSMHIVLEMMRKRIAAGAHLPTMTSEANELARLFAEQAEHKGLARPKAKTIINALASEYRRLTFTPEIK